MFIPLYCASILYSNENIDIEIGVSCDKLSEDIEKSLEILRKLYPFSQIKIDYSLFEEVKNKAILNDGRKCIFNTVRFLTEPTIKNEYVYISDIDIIMLDKDFINCHLDDMTKNHRNYSNIVRKNTKRMSGLHFTKWNALYPLTVPSNINLLKNDEEILHDLVRTKNTIDLETTFRPVHGIHMSLNRPDVFGGQIVGWITRRDEYKKEWEDFSKTIMYKMIFPHFCEEIKELIKKLEKNYKNI